MNEYKNKIYKAEPSVVVDDGIFDAIIIVTPEDEWYLYHSKTQIWKSIGRSLKGLLKSWDVQEINHLQLLVETNTSRAQAESIHHYAVSSTM